MGRFPEKSSMTRGRRGQDAGEISSGHCDSLRCTSHALRAGASGGFSHEGKRLRNVFRDGSDWEKITQLIVLFNRERERDRIMYFNVVCVI